MLEFANIIYESIIWFFLTYGIAVFLVYGWIAIYALGAVLQYKKENTFTDYTIIASNPNAPTFSIIAPAYNEGMTIVENVRSLLSLYYHNLEIIIVNDGSKDDSMQKLIEAYELESISFFVQGTIATNKVRGIYKSKNPAFKKLIVVDKENGGKADALNVGINVSTGHYLVCIDVDCILEQDAILKLAKPFLQQTDKKVIACGGVIRLANNCKIENGKVTDVNIPKTLLGRTQALEYIRAFILGRMAWSRASGLILISGAFGVFDRKIVLACGGYDKNTVGEDMELVVRMRKYMEEKKEPYQVITIPDPLCWTEAPESKEVLKKQRNRWMRGTMETLWKHRKMMFNPKYGKLGMVSLPYWFLFEFLGPLIEFSGYIIFFIFIILGLINWSFFLILFALVLSAGFLFSIYGIFVDLVGQQVYVKRKDFIALIGTALLEPFYFHPIVVKAAVGGFIDYFKKSHAWGEMTRQGFNQQNQNLPFNQKIFAILSQGLKKWGVFAAVFVLLFFVGVTAEWVWYRYTVQDLNQSSIVVSLFLGNLIFIFKTIAILGIIYVVLNSFKESWAKFFAITTGTITIVAHYLLFLYFSESHNMLGADFLFYNSEEIKQILQASGLLNVKNFALIAILIAFTVTPFWMSSRTRFLSKYVGLAFISIGIVLSIFPADFLHVKTDAYANEFTENAVKSKGAYFFNSNLDNYLSNHPEITDFFGNSNDIVANIEMIDTSFPFWRKETTADFLGPYLNKSNQTPNLVLIMIEGLGHAYSSPKGYVGNFTPFIDSLGHKSLYWENTLSSAGRTFAAIPTLTGSLPFGKNGFLEIKKTPAHFNLYNILKSNGFQTGFFYGGNSSFDRIREFLEYSKVDTLVDQFSYEEPDRRLPGNDGESWGFEDQAVFKKMLAVQKPQSQPYFNAILTLSSHNPFLINDAESYEKMYKKRLITGQLNAEQKKWALNNKKQLISLLNADDALRTFFENYKRRNDFKNTIFIITGDHSMPEITLQSKIDRFHVPLLIYSPLLKEPKVFDNIVSHFDLAPSILAYYRTNYNLKTPSSVAWVGRGLLQNPELGTIGIPMMKSKNLLIDYVYGNYHIEENQLYQLKNLEESALDRPAMFKKVNQNFNQFKSMNTKFYETQKLLPDSVITNYFKIKVSEN